MFISNRTHIALLFLYGIIVFLAIWGLLSHVDDASHLPISIWAAIGAVGASGAMLEILAHIRTRNALKQMENQIQKMSKSVEVGLVMIEEQWPVSGLAGILNEYLTFLQGRISQLARERKELDLLIRVADAEKQNTEAIVQNISDAVIVVDSFGELTLANSLAEKLFGFTLTDKKNQPIEEILNDPKLLPWLDPDRWQEKREPIKGECELTLADGMESKVFIVTVSPVYIRRDELWGLAMTLHDVTRERQLDRMKNDFVNHVSHELRTPLSSIKAYIELLIDGDIKTPEGRSEFYRIIDSEVHRLDRFIDNMLNLSRIESGLMSVEFTPVTLNDELQKSVELVRFLAQEKTISLKVIAPSQDISIQADRDLFRQVILNLLSNAVKYTLPGGTIVVKAGLDDKGTNCRISVHDTGIGIDPSEIHKIFEKFHRSANGKKVSGGTGLGLALVKKIVEQIHRGSVEIQSVLGSGSEFIVTLPVDQKASPGSDKVQAVGQEAVAV